MFSLLNIVTDGIMGEISKHRGQCAILYVVHLSPLPRVCHHNCIVCKKEEEAIRDINHHALFFIISFNRFMQALCYKCIVLYTYKHPSLLMCMCTFDCICIWYCVKPTYSTILYKLPLPPLAALSGVPGLSYSWHWDILVPIPKDSIANIITDHIPSCPFWD